MQTDLGDASLAQSNTVKNRMFSKTSTDLDIVEMQMIAICYKSNSYRGSLLTMFPMRPRKTLSDSVTICSYILLLISNFLMLIFNKTMGKPLKYIVVFMIMTTI